MTSNQEDTGEVSFWRFGWLFLAVVVLWGGAWILAAGFVNDWQKKLQTGDVFDATNALFSGLAFAGVIITVALQRRELQLQRKELEMTREELRRTAAAQEASEKSLSEQAHALKTAARLNALTSLVENYQIKINRIQGANAKEAANARRANFVDQLEQLLDQLSADPKE